ncbi:MAG: hypothetical protein SFW66_09325 [Gammaproteobacteria bacterium]|nr:hypothetical protein [Gammaproteobacteria bacterium]
MLPHMIENLSDYTHSAEPLALQNHPHLFRTLDALIQKDQHHVLFSSDESAIVHREFARTCQAQLKESNMPYALHDAHVFYFNTQQLDTTNIATKLYSLSRYDKKNILMIHVSESLPESFTSVLREYLTHPTWRFIFFVSSKNNASFSLPVSLFTQLTFVPPRHDAILQLLKSQQKSLEDFHQVSIPDAIFPAALALATRYIAGQALFDKTLTLIESAAAHVNTSNHPVTAKQTLTPHWLMQTVSQWTNIPLSHLQADRFSVNLLADALQETIVGQEEAIWQIATTLNNACFRMNDKVQPFCQFLLVSDENNCHRALSEALSDYFFGDHHALLRLYLDQTAHETLDNLRVVQHSTTTAMTLLHAVKQMPYAIILIESIESIRTETFSLFKTILTDGFAVDQNGDIIDFRHTIIFMTTTLGANEIKQFNDDATSQQSVDLLQLMPRAGKKQQTASHLESIATTITQTLAKQLPIWLLQHAEIIPLMPLNLSHIEEIVSRKIIALKQQLMDQSNIDLDIANEVTQFLAYKMIHKPFANTAETIFEQFLHPRITQQMISQPTASLFSVRLNETGKFLICTAKEMGDEDLSFPRRRESILDISRASNEK